MVKAMPVKLSQVHVYIKLGLSQICKENPCVCSQENVQIEAQLESQYLIKSFTTCELTSGKCMAMAILCYCMNLTANGNGLFTLQ